MTTAEPSTTAAPPAGRRAGRSQFVRILLSEYLVLLIAVAYTIAIYPFVPEILSVEVATNILSDMMPLLVVAIGQTFVLVVGGIDLSVTAVISLAAVVGASAMTLSGGYFGEGPLAVPGAIALMLAVGLLIGAVNGLSTVLLNMPSFIVTLATRMFFAGAAIWYTTFHTKSSSIANLPDPFTAIADGQIASFSIGEGTFVVPLTFAIALVVGVVAHLALSRSVLGRWIYAVGLNPKAARVSGVPVARTIVIAFLISGVCAAIASVMYTSRMQTGSPIAGENILLDVIGAVVIGGTSLFGGKGKIIWTVFGVLFLVLLDTTMKLLGASLFAIFMIKGSVILLAALIDTLRNKILADR